MSITWRTTKPAADEYAPFYAGYIAEAGDGDVVEILERQLGETLSLFRGIGEERGGHRYAEGKWSIRGVLNHVIDAERVFAYRVLRAVRNDATELPGFDETTWAAAARADDRTLAGLCGEFAMVRGANLALFTAMSDEEAARRVVANGRPVSARALVWIIAGHERHHGGVVRERYL